MAKQIMLIGGIVMFIGAIALLYFNIDSYKVQTQGIIVKMRIEKLPTNCIGTKVKHYVTLTYENRKYIKMTPGLFCQEHTVGQFIEMKFLDGYPIVLFPEESALSNLLAGVALCIIGLVIFVKSLLR